MNKIRLSTKFWTLCLLALFSVLSTVSPYFISSASADTATCPPGTIAPINCSSRPTGCSDSTYSNGTVNTNCPSSSPAVTGNPASSGSQPNIPAGCPGTTTSTQVTTAPTNCPSSGQANTIPAGCPGTTSTTQVKTAPTNCPVSAGAAADSTKASCESSGFSLAWILCPIINLMSTSIDGIYSHLIKPLLETSPLSLSTQNNPQYDVWSQFRILGDVFLVIALLVIVFGQSFGGGLIDAYSAKKILPRILAAAVLINLSYYIVALAVDVSNIIGGGIQSLILTPFHLSNEEIRVGGFSSGLGLAAIFATGGGIWALVATGGVLDFLPAFALFILLPFILIVLAILAVVIFRQGLILLLVLMSPIAFALYCLPNTEQYFRKWWDLLLKTLLVYPIIAILFAMGNVFAITITRSQTTYGPLTALLGVISLFVPLFLIPFAFKLAGGALGRMHEVISTGGKRAVEGIKGNPNDQRSLRNRTRYNARSNYNDRRAETFDKFAAKTTAGSGSRLKRGVYGAMARGVGYGNVEADRSAMNEDQEKIIGAQYSTGGDNSVRAYWAKKYTGPTEYLRDDKDAIRKDENGNDMIARQAGGYYTYQNADGSYKQWSDADVAKANRIVGKDPSRVQSYAKYEMNKAADDGQLVEFKKRFLEKCEDNGYTSSQMNKIWGGDKFAMQQTRKELKHTNIIDIKDAQGNRTGKFDYSDVNDNTFSNELVDSVRRGDVASFRSSTAKAALKGYTKIDSIPEADRTEAQKAAFSNYQQLGRHMQDNVFSAPQSRAAAAGANQEHEDGGNDAGGYGFGGSVRAEAAWKEFAKQTTSGGTGASPQPPTPGPAPRPAPPTPGDE
jgi:hypothetical protein